MRKQELHPRTASINHKQKLQAKKARNEALNWLARSFPQAFDTSTSIQPLKLGIMTDILAYADKAAEVGISKSKLREGVVIFTRRIDYLASLKAREMRIDLQGNPTHPVTEEEAEQAATKIRKQVEKSIKNARKTVVNKATVNQKPAVQATPDFPSYAERPPAFSAQYSIAPTAKTAAVVVKHKPVRQYDPDAVARLKEKLGLSRKLSVDKEPAE